MATAKPATKSTTTDDAQATEAVEGTASVEYGGETYEFPANVLDMPLEFLDALRTNDATAILALALGDAQMAKFRKTKPTVRSGTELLTKVIEAIGFDDLGN
ncbi:hypothetical protein AN220_00665 [Streptomyces nanshensis]|nr:hypothetical protein AN220_00665 [Streptomyces nanshensis]